jgi:biotin transport system substrate-specific component
MIALFTSLTAVGGMINIPFVPIPVTLQTFFVYLAGDLLGHRKAVYSQVLYIYIGLIGLPVFTRGGGLGYVAQPTFGYLLGFPLAAGIIGFLLERSKRSNSLREYIFANTFGALIILTIGVIYLYMCTNFIKDEALSWNSAIIIGALYFLPFDAVKVVISGEVARRLKNYIDWE